MISSFSTSFQKNPKKAPEFAQLNWTSYQAQREVDQCTPQLRWCIRWDAQRREFGITNKSKQRKCWVLVCADKGCTQVSSKFHALGYGFRIGILDRFWYNQTGRSNSCVSSRGGAICQQTLKQHQSYGRFGHRCDGVTALEDMACDVVTYFYTVHHC